MGNSKRCTLTLHTLTREILIGEFKSKKEAKEYAKFNFTRPYTIKVIKGSSKPSKLVYKTL